MLKIIENWLYATKYIVVFINMQNKEYEEVGRKVYRDIKSFQNSPIGKFIADKKRPCYLKHNKRYYFVEYKGKKTFTFSEQDQPMNLLEVDLIVANKLIQQISSGLMDDYKMKITYLIIGGIVGVLVGLFIMNIISQNKIDKLYKEWIDSQPTIITMIKGWFNWKKLLRIR